MRKYSSYMLFLLLAIFVVILSVNNFGPLVSMQQSLDDFLCALTADDSPRPNVVTVTIDGRAQAEFGQWPWTRDLLADLVAATAAGEPKVVVLGVDLSENIHEDSTGNTDILADEMSWIENVIIAYDISLSSFRSNATSNPDHLFNYSVSVDNPLGLMQEDATLIARKTFLPTAKLLEISPKLGFDYVQPDHDRVLRHQPLLVHYEGYYYPALPLIAAAAYRGVSASDIRVIEGSKVQVGNHTVIPINEQSEYFVNFPPQGSIVNFSASDILSDRFNRSQLAGKLVIIGLNDIAARESFRTVQGDAATKLQIHAAVAENIINSNFLTPQRGAGTSILIMLILGALFAFLLPQVPVMYRFIILIVGLILLVNVNYFMVSAFRVIPETIYIALELLLFLAASPMLESQLIRGEAPRHRKNLADLDPLALAERRQVRPEDIARAPVRELRDRAGDPENAPTTMIDYASIGAGTRSDEAPADHSAIDIDKRIDFDEQPAPNPDKRDQRFDASLIDDDDLQISEASSSSQTMISKDDEYGDISLAAPTTEAAPGASAGTDSGPWGTGQQGQANIPASLGRYQITGALGKGAMGLVYKGVDPAINRPVALKTIRLDFVTDPEELNELKERLYREAQAAGKLSHPNIVTIYDVGSDGPLQYIAMEYLEGRTLEDMIKKKTKFNYRIIAEIILQICSALQYAHQQGIVHRDIKPANIMVLKDYRVKVMDYGIARIDTSSMTKTGIAMGTPNYISPEQLRGQKSDHRADLFSLGVVMYEMLLGRRPFKGENITSLIYAIINHEPDKPSDINPQIPMLFDHIIMKALKKDPQKRYQRAAEIATDLKDFVESFATGA